MKGFQSNFVRSDGVRMIGEWLKPPFVRGEFAWAPTNLIDVCLRLLDILPLDKDILKTSDIGKRVKEVMQKKNPIFPVETRDVGQRLINKWVKMVINPAS